MLNWEFQQMASGNFYARAVDRHGALYATVCFVGGLPSSGGYMWRLRLPNDQWVSNVAIVPTDKQAAGAVPIYPTCLAAARACLKYHHSI